MFRCSNSLCTSAQHSNVNSNRDCSSAIGCSIHSTNLNSIFFFIRSWILRSTQNHWNKIRNLHRPYLYRNARAFDDNGPTEIGSLFQAPPGQSSILSSGTWWKFYENRRRTSQFAKRHRVLACLLMRLLLLSFYCQNISHFYCSLCSDVVSFFFVDRNWLPCQWFGAQVHRLCLSKQWWSNRMEITAENSLTALSAAFLLFWVWRSLRQITENVITSNGRTY